MKKIIGYALYCICLFNLTLAETLIDPLSFYYLSPLIKDIEEKEIRSETCQIFFKYKNIYEELKQKKYFSPWHQYFQIFQKFASFPPQNMIQKFLFPLAYPKKPLTEKTRETFCKEDEKWNYQLGAFSLRWEIKLFEYEKEKIGAGNLDKKIKISEIRFFPDDNQWMEDFDYLYEENDKRFLILWCSSDENKKLDKTLHWIGGEINNLGNFIYNIKSQSFSKYLNNLENDLTQYENQKIKINFFFSRVPTLKKQTLPCENLRMQKYQVINE